MTFSSLFKFESCVPISNESYCVYYLFDEGDYMKGYIGITTDINRRLQNHVDDREKFNTRKNAWFKNRIGSSSIIYVEILESGLSKLDACFWEKWYISYFKSMLFELKNMTFGGDGGVPTQEVRQKMSRNRKGVSTPAQMKARSESGKRHKGVKRSEETRRRMSLGGKGKKFSKESILKGVETRRKKGLFLPENNNMYGKYHSEETKLKMAAKRKIPIFISYLDGTEVGRFDSSKDASLILGISRVSIWGYLNGKLKSIGYKYSAKYA